MKLHEYINLLQTVVEEKPEALDFIVVYASDDEGNSYEDGINAPSFGEFDDSEFNWESDKPNAICIN